MNLHVMGGDKNPINKEDESYWFPRATSFLQIQEECMNKQEQQRIFYVFITEKTHFNKNNELFKENKVPGYEL